MKQILFAVVFLIMGAVSPGQPRDQLVERAEYYINVDPGKGLATSISISQGYEVPLEISHLSYSPGDVLYIRAFSQNGWSDPVGIALENRSFQRNANLVRAEWFLNESDPGLGQGRMLNIGGGSEEAINEQVDPLASRHDVIRVRSVHTGNVYGKPVSLTLSENLITDAEVGKVKWSISGARQIEPITWTFTDQMYHGLIREIQSEPLHRNTFGAADTVVVRAKGVNEIWGPEYQIIIPKRILKYKYPVLSVRNTSTDVAQATLTWTSENNNEEGGFRIFRTDGTGWKEVASSPANQYVYVDQAIQAGGSYCWKVQAIDVDTIYNSPFSNEACLENVTDLDDASAPVGIALHQNYPNPFSGETTISYSMQGSSVVSLSVYDMLGREVYRLVDKQSQAPGMHQVAMKATGLMPGVYIYRLITEKQSLSRRMLVASGN
ncbi:MAG: hypothetical protein CL946_00985 [Ectothiorhodospiraceae bacterium]|nr:hypothetical protein [Ectothiorhodospiraceae bacterium]